MEPNVIRPNEVFDLDFATPESHPADLSSLLVELYDSVRAYRSGQVDDGIKRNICNYINGMFEVPAMPSEREMAVDVLVSLVKQSERDLKQALAERLSIMEQVPLRLLLQFLNEDISIARPVIEQSPVLNDLDLLYIIQSRDSPFWQAIAARRNLRENVADALAETHDIPTARILAANDTAALSSYALDILFRMAGEDADLAKPLLMRHDIPADLVRTLYARVGKDVRSYILERYTALDLSQSDERGRAVEAAIGDVLDEFTTSRKLPADYMPTDSMVRAADMFMKQGKLDSVLMLRTLNRGQVPSFIAQMSAYSGVPVGTVLDLVFRKGGQGLAVLAKGSALSLKEFLTMYLMVARIYPALGETNATGVERAKELFHAINMGKAKEILDRSRN